MKEWENVGKKAHDSMFEKVGKGGIAEMAGKRNV
jgi:hypothetical protein